MLTNGSRGKFIDMAPHKDFFKLGFPLDNNVVTKVGIELVHNLSTNRGMILIVDSQPLFSINFYTPKALNLSSLMGLSTMKSRVIYFSKNHSFSNPKKKIGIGNFREVPWGGGYDFPFLFEFGRRWL